MNYSRNIIKPYLYLELAFTMKIQRTCNQGTYYQKEQNKGYIKVKWALCQGIQLCQLHFVFHINWGSTLKRKNLLLREEILSFKS